MNKVFKQGEIYDLLNAENAAYSFEEETGCKSAWYDFCSEEYNSQFDQLDDEDEFERKLRQATEKVHCLFGDLETIEPESYDDEQEFEDARREIQAEILAEAYDELGDYILDEE